ncbi:MAG: hypothetical protein P9L89_03105 [Candidatus Celaenobacter polaris]|jgi:hypothetical protein|nr:hypothetical protein [Candidatus Celaenobacter polaris]
MEKNILLGTIIAKLFVILTIAGIIKYNIPAFQSEIAPGKMKKIHITAYKNFR